ncbi:uncharacterized protein METZ01_LOCUS140351, partial [marine metagenome]
MLARGPISILLGTALLLPSSTYGQAPEGTLSLDTYLDWESVSNPKISPDGREIAYTRTWVDQMKDSRPSSIWIMNRDGSKNRFLTSGSGPTWSPDGTRIAFLDEGDSGSQIFVRWMDDEGATSQITRVELSPGNLRWAPDGTQIAFTMTVESPASEWSVTLPDRPDGAEWIGDPKVVERLSYRRDRRGYIDDGYTHIFV